MKVISFGLWGNSPRYIEGAEANVILARRFYPGWQCWFFCDQTVPKETLDTLARQPDCRVMVADSTKERQHRLFWRFWAAAYEEVEVMMIRDTDSRIGQREQMAVADWLSKGTSFHIMRDSPAHGVPMCGGMWGCYANRLRNIRQAINKYYDEGKHNTVLCGVDQDFLHQVVWPVAMHDCTEHDDFFAKKPFPYIPRHERHYVGRVFDPSEFDYKQNTPLLRKEVAV
jgi:hypothetical protein